MSVTIWYPASPSVVFAPDMASDTLYCTTVSLASTWMIRATVDVRCWARERAALFGVYLDSLMAAAMRSEASLETCSLLLRKRDTAP